MIDNTAKIIDFERFKAARNGTTPANSDSRAPLGGLYPVPVFCVFYVPYQPTVFWPAVI
jgi:hypothetical protein